MDSTYSRAMRIEKLVAQIKSGLLTGNEKLDAADGLSAVLTFASRFAKGMLLMSKTAEARESNRESMVGLIRQIADELEEWQEDEGAGPTLH